MGTVNELIDPNFCIVNFAVVAVLFLSLFFFFFFLNVYLFVFFFVFHIIYPFFKGRGERVNLN